MHRSMSYPTAAQPGCASVLLATARPIGDCCWAGAGTGAIASAVSDQRPAATAWEPITIFAEDTEKNQGACRLRMRTLQTRTSQVCLPPSPGTPQPSPPFPPIPCSPSHSDSGTHTKLTLN